MYLSSEAFASVNYRESSVDKKREIESYLENKYYHDDIEEDIQVIIPAVLESVGIYLSHNTAK